MGVSSRASAAPEEPAAEQELPETEEPAVPPKSADASAADEVEQEDGRSEPEETEKTEKTDDGPTLEDALYEEAVERFEEGGRLFARRRYLEAAAAYERSFIATAVGNTLYNLGLSYEKGGNIVRAIEAYERYVALPDCPAPQDLCANRRSEVRNTILELKKQVGELTILVDEGVELRGIEIDGSLIPPEDFPLVLEPGRFELRIRGRRRGQVRTRSVEIDAGQRTSLLISGFEPPTKPQVRPDPIVDDRPERENRRISEQERRRRLKIAFYSGVGLTALAGIGVGVTGGLTLRAYNAQKDRCRGEGQNCFGTDYPADERDRVERLRPVTNALVGVTAALGITTVVVGLFAFSRESDGSSGGVTRVQAGPGSVRIRF